MTPVPKVEVECPDCKQRRQVRKGRVQLQKAWGTFTGRCKRCTRATVKRREWGRWN